MLYTYVSSYASAHRTYRIWLRLQMYGTVPFDTEEKPLRSLAKELLFVFFHPISSF
jgi:hypothetical protein